MIDQLHPSIHRKPGGRMSEELVVVGVDIESANVGHELWADPFGIEGIKVDA